MANALTGLAFGPASFPSAYAGLPLAARWNGLFPIVDDLIYGDVVLVDPVSGQVDRVITGFNSPTDVVADAHGHLYRGTTYRSPHRLRP